MHMGVERVFALKHWCRVGVGAVQRRKTGPGPLSCDRVELPREVYRYGGIEGGWP